MLALTRRENEDVIITLPDGDIIQITVISILGNRIRLGFTADKKYQIHREEIWMKRCNENAERNLQNMEDDILNRLQS